MRKFGFLFFFFNAFAQLNTQLMGLERGVYWSAFFSIECASLASERFRNIGFEINCL